MRTFSPCGDSRAAPTAGVVAKCVGEEVLQHPPQQAHIAVDRKAALHHGELDPTGLGQHAEFRLEIVQHIAQGEIELLRLELARLEARDVQQIGDEILGRPRRRRCGERCGPVRPPGQHLQQGGSKELGRVQRLGQVVAHRRKEPALGLVGPLHLLVYQQQLAVEFGELVGALGHPRLQVLVRFPQHPLRRPERGDIGEGHDKAPAGMGLPCISMTRPSGRSRAETWGCHAS